MVGRQGVIRPLAGAAKDPQVLYDRAVLLHERDRAVSARRLYEEAAAVGQPAAMNALGKLLGRLNKTDEAAVWLRRGIAAGDVEALWNLAMILRVGSNRSEVDQLVDRAERQWLQAATGGTGDSLDGGSDPAGPLAGPSLTGEVRQRFSGQMAKVIACEAAASLAMLYQFRGDEQSHRRWLTQTEAGYRALAEAGNTDARRRLGEFLLEANRAAEAEPWLLAGARAGDDRAMVLLAVALRDRGAAQQARGWLRRAAWKGNARAMGGIGEMFAHSGRLVRAKWWLRLAARAGSPGAMNNLGILLKAGGHFIGAAYWYRRAAQAGHPAAHHNLRLLWQEAGQPY